MAVTHGLAAVFFAVAMVFVQRSSDGMRIGRYAQGARCVSPGSPGGVGGCRRARSGRMTEIGDPVSNVKGGRLEPRRVSWLIDTLLGL
jgi:hypothetical protein